MQLDSKFKLSVVTKKTDNNFSMLWLGSYMNCKHTTYYRNGDKKMVTLIKISDIATNQKFLLNVIEIGWSSRTYTDLTFQFNCGLIVL